MRLERGGCGGKRARRSAKVAHRERHLGLGNKAAGARQFLVGAKASGGPPQELARTWMLAKLRHGNAAQGQRRRVVAQGDPLEGTERVAGGKRPRGGGDQGIHRSRRLTRPVGRPIGVVQYNLFRKEARS